MQHQSVKRIGIGETITFQLREFNYQSDNPYCEEQFQLLFDVIGISK